MVKGVLRIFSMAGLLWGAMMLLSSDVWAAAAAKRIQEQKAMQQQLLQQQYQQQVAQQQAQQVAAYQQAVAERQVQMQQIAAQQKAAAEYAAYKQAMQEAVAQRAAQAQAAQAAQQMQNVAAYQQAQAVQKAAAAKSQSELNGQVQEYAQYLAKRQAVMGQQAVAVQQAQTAMEMAQYYERQKVAAVQNRIALQARVQQEAVRRKMGQLGLEGADARRAAEAVAAESPAAPSEETVVAIEDLWSALDQGSLAWQKIVDADIKRLTVAEYMDRFRKLGIKISRSPGEYVETIDSMASQNPGFLQAPFMSVLSYAAIVEYDFDNGGNKDEMARKVLGEENFLANKKRLFKR